MATFNVNIQLTGDCQNTNSGAFRLNLTGVYNTPITLQWVYPFNDSYVLSSNTRTTNNPLTYERLNLSSGTYVYNITESGNNPDSVNNLGFFINSSSTVSLTVSAGTSCDSDNGVIIANTPYVYDYCTLNLYKNNNIFSSYTLTGESFAITGLSYGLYYANIDNGGCQGTSDTVFIDDSPALNFGFYTINSPACYFRGGRIIVTGLTGTPPYSYNWSADTVQWGIPPTGDTATGLTSGNFLVTVTDSAGCQVSKEVTLDTAFFITLVTSLRTSPTCNSNNGELYYVISGGSPPYYYQLSNGDNIVSYNQSVTFTGLAANNYTLNVTDAALCTLSNTQFLSTPNVFTTLSVTKTDSTCAFNDGTVVATVQGGSPPYTFSIYNSNSGYSQSQVSFVAQNIFKNLSSDTYTVSIKDKTNTCEYSEEVVIENITPFDFTLSKSDTTCGYQNGTVTVNVTPNSSASTLFQYFLSNGGTSAVYTSTTYTFSGLSPNTYDLTVLDVNNRCRQTKSIYVASSSPPNLFLSNTGCLQGSGGTISALIQGTSGDYVLSWSNNVNEQTGIYLTGLTAGTYTLTLSGENGCVYNSTTTIDCNPVRNTTYNYKLSTANSYNKIPSIIEIEQMAFSGFSSSVGGYQDCILNSAQVNLVVDIGFDEYVFPYYLITDLDITPSYSEYVNFVKISIESIPFIQSCEINLINNTVTIVGEVVNGVEYYNDEDISLSVRIDYDVNCASLDNCPCANLVLKLDASNDESYPGNGNIWYDLSSKSNNSILSGNSISFVEEYGGGIRLNTQESNDGYLQLPTGTLDLNSIAQGNSYSIVIAYKKEFYSDSNDGTSSLILGGTNGLTLGWRLIDASSGGTQGVFSGDYVLSYGSPGNNPINYTLNGDVCLAVVTKDGNSVKTFIDNQLFENTNSNIYQSGSNVGYVGKKGFGVGSFNGVIYLLYIYSSALTSPQMEDVYNSLKGRFN
jgi:hypothetical protein